jgi:glycyl-tRNA synthetase
VLATVMRKHQRYLPVRDTHGALLSCFVAVANGPIDAEVVRAGNEAVLRARYEDAAFFHHADLAVAPAQLRQRLTGLAGVMAGEYATAAGEPPAVAQALYEAELPRHAGDHLPTTPAGAILSLADRIDYLAGLATTVGLPTGSSDPFALRRAALGALAVHRTNPPCPTCHWWMP